MYLPTRRWVAGARSAANPCAASPFCESLILAYQNLSSLLSRPQQKQSARISGRAVDSGARMRESRNYVRFCMQPLVFAVCSWVAAWRATGCSPPCVLTPGFRLFVY